MFKWFKKIFCSRSKAIDEAANVVESIGKAKTLYRELLIKAHPDRNSEKKEIAQEITDRINQNRYNYKELTKIQEELTKRLNN